MGTPATICYLSFLDYYELSFLDCYELSFRRAVSNGDSYLSHPVFDGEGRNCTFVITVVIVFNNRRKVE